MPLNENASASQKPIDQTRVDVDLAAPQRKTKRIWIYLKSVIGIFLTTAFPWFFEGEWALECRICGRVVDEDRAEAHYRLFHSTEI